MPCAAQFDDMLAHFDIQPLVAIPLRNASGSSDHRRRQYREAVGNEPASDETEPIRHAEPMHASGDVLDAMRARRNFRGDRNNPVFDKGRVYLWQMSFRKATSGANKAKCAKVMRKYEPQVRLSWLRRGMRSTSFQVREFGYSLLDLNRVQATARIRPFMLPDE